MERKPLLLKSSDRNCLLFGNLLLLGIPLLQEQNAKCWCGYSHQLPKQWAANLRFFGDAILLLSQEGKGFMRMSPQCSSCHKIEGILLIHQSVVSPLYHSGIHSLYQSLYSQVLVFQSVWAQHNAFRVGHSNYFIHGPFFFVFYSIPMLNFIFFIN